MLRSSQRALQCAAGCWRAASTLRWAALSTRDQYNAAAASLVDANANAMTFTAKWPPQYEVAPDTVTVQDGSLAAQYAIVASSPLKSVTCDLCSVALVLCRTTGLGTNYSTLTITGRNGAAFPDEYECTAVDSEGLHSSRVDHYCDDTFRDQRADRFRLQEAGFGSGTGSGVGPCALVVSHRCNCLHKAKALVGCS